MKLDIRWQCVLCKRYYALWWRVVNHVEKVHNIHSDHASESEIRTVQ